MMKPHFIRVHLPQALHLNSKCVEQVKALQFLAEQLNFSSLQTMANSILPTFAADPLTINPALVQTMIDLCRQLGIEGKNNAADWVAFRSPAILLHWRVLAALINRLTPVQREAFAKWTPPVTPAVVSRVEARDPIVQTIDDFLASPSPVEGQEEMDIGLCASLSEVEVPDKTPVLKAPIVECPQSFTRTPPVSFAQAVKSRPRPVLSSPGRTEGLGILDGHFHLDRMLGRNAKVSTMVRTLPSRIPSAPCEVKGGVVVFCDPRTYPTQIQASLDVAGFVAAVGIHPKHIAHLNDRHWGAFKTLMQSPNVKAIGEVGLDYTAKGINKQETRLRHILVGFADPSRPVILHLRGRKGDEDEIYFRALGLVRKCLSEEQPIQLHCFSGGPGVFAAWHTSFPNVYASYSGLVRHFTEHQITGLKSVPADRLLLETDAPYLPTTGSKRDNTPHHLLEVAELVAKARAVPTAEVVNLCNKNLCRLFKISTDLA